MWYDEAIMRLQKKESFSRKELFSILQGYHSELSYNSFKWILSDLISKQLIIRKGYDTYCCCKDERRIVYHSIYGEVASKLKQWICEKYPLIEFCVFESYLLNEFLNHQIAQNTIVIQVEKEVSAFVFDFLQEQYTGRVLYKPDEETYQRYWCENCVVVVDKVSESPKDRQNPYDITLEKLLVDLFSEQIIKRLFSPSEYPFIMETALERYCVDERKMLRYARRRSAASKIMEYLQ